MVLIALAMVVILSFLAIVIDVGFAYVARRHRQNAADSAARAAAILVAQGAATSADVQAEIDKYVVYNEGTVGNGSTVRAYFLDGGGSVLSEVATGDPSTAQGVLVVSETNVDGFFSQVLGFPTLSVGAASRAMAYWSSGPTGLAGLPPMSVPDVPLSKGNKYQLWNSNHGGYQSFWNGKDPTLPFPGDNSFKGLLSYHGIGSRYDDPAKQKELGAWIEIGLDVPLPTEQSIPHEGGTVAAVEDRIGARFNLTKEYEESTGRWYMYYPVPVIRYIPVGESDPNHPGCTADAFCVVGFQAFRVYEGDWDSNTLWGTPTELVIDTSTPTGGSRTARLVTLEPVDPVTIPTAPAATATPAGTATSTPGATATGTPAATATSTPAPTATSTPAPTPTSTPVPCQLKQNGNCDKNNPPNCVCPPGS